MSCSMVEVPRGTHPSRNSPIGAGVRQMDKTRSGVVRAGEVDGQPSDRSFECLDGSVHGTGGIRCGPFQCFHEHSAGYIAFHRDVVDGTRCSHNKIAVLAGLNSSSSDTRRAFWWLIPFPSLEAPIASSAP